MAEVSRRNILKQTGAAILGLAIPFTPDEMPETTSGDDPQTVIRKIADPDIRVGVDAAVNKNLLPSAIERVYPGHFTINADGGGYGNDTTWPGLDSWQMAGAYLLVGKTRLVTDYFDFVRASQRKDGNIPFAIFNGDTKPGNTYLRGMRVPDDVFTYAPPKRDDLLASSQETRQWVGLFRHWELKSNPLSTLGPICYLLTAAEIVDATRDASWLTERLPSIEATAKYLVTRITDNGLIGGSGFYTELPPLSGWDGVTQCYTVHAFRELARVLHSIGKKKESLDWTNHANRLSKRFAELFWRDDHFVEYIHVERGPIDSHGLTDTNWAAVAFGLADDRHLHTLWPRLTEDKAFWLGDMPTQTVTKPFTYENWENDPDWQKSPVPFDIGPYTNDVSAMGRTWYLEAMACRRMHAYDRLVTAASLVSRAAEDGFWRERYHPNPNGTVAPAGARKYCEYPAILARVVLGNREHFQ